MPRQATNAVACSRRPKALSDFEAAKSDAAKHEAGICHSRTEKGLKLCLAPGGPRPISSAICALEPVT
jgi:hypothetical protein